MGDFLFNTEDAMIRIDMSEYMEKHAVSRLPIKRAVQQYLETSVAKAILRGEVAEEDIAVVSAKRVEDGDFVEGGQQFEFEVKRKRRAKKQKLMDSIDEAVPVESR